MLIESHNEGIDLLFKIMENSKELLKTCIADPEGGIVNRMYAEIKNSYILAPNDKMLHYWWQKEVLLFLPLLEGTELNIGGFPYLTREGKLPNTWEEANDLNLIDTIPPSVRELIIRRANGIMIRTNILKSKKKDMSDEEKREYIRKKQDRARKSLQIKQKLLQECTLNYVRAQISKYLLLNKMNSCNEITSNRSTVDEKYEQQQKVSEKEKRKILSVEGRDITQKPDSEQNIFMSTDMADSMKTMYLLNFESVSDTSSKIKPVYKPITPSEWVKINILSTQQLMLECWSMPLDEKSTKKGDDTTLYMIPASLLTKQSKKRGTTELLNIDAFSIGDKVYYKNKTTGLDTKTGEIDYAECTIVGIDHVQGANGQELVYDIQFTESTEIGNPNLTYIPKESPLWLKFKLLTEYLNSTVSVLNDDIASLFKIRDLKEKITIYVGPKKQEVLTISEVEKISGVKVKFTGVINRKPRLPGGWTLKKVGLDYKKFDPDNVLFKLLKYEAFSQENTKLSKRKDKSSKKTITFVNTSGVLTLTETRVRLCKLWLLFTSMMGWCTYEDLFKGAPGLPNDVENNRYILARRKTGVTTLDQIRGKPWISCGWAKLVFGDGILKLEWIDRWRKRNKESKTAGELACKIAPASGPPCWVPKQDKLKWNEYWTKGPEREKVRAAVKIQTMTRNKLSKGAPPTRAQTGPVFHIGGYGSDSDTLMDGGAKCNIQELLLRTKIPAGNSLKILTLSKAFSSAEDDGATKLNKNKIANPYSIKAMNEFAKNFKITKIMLNPEDCGEKDGISECKNDKQCMIEQSVPEGAEIEEML